MRVRGFTLLELMIVCAVVGILAAIAYPSYVSYIQKTNRAEGKGALLAAAIQMERYLTERNTYATATLGAGGVYPTTTEHNTYTLSLPSVAASTYTLRATPVGAQARPLRFPDLHRSRCEGRHRYDGRRPVLVADREIAGQRKVRKHEDRGDEHRLGGKAHAAHPREYLACAQRCPGVVNPTGRVRRTQ